MNYMMQIYRYNLKDCGVSVQRNEARVPFLFTYFAQRQESSLLFLVMVTFNEKYVWHF